MLCFDINSNAHFQTNYGLTQTKIKPKLKRGGEKTCGVKLKKHNTKM